MEWYVRPREDVVDVLVKWLKNQKVKREPCCLLLRVSPETSRDEFRFR